MLLERIKVNMKPINVYKHLKLKTSIVYFNWNKIPQRLNLTI